MSGATSNSLSVQIMWVGLCVCVGGWQLGEIMTIGKVGEGRVLVGVYGGSYL